MKIISPIIISLLLTSTLSCTEKNEKTELNSILDKIKKGKGDESDVDKLLESVSKQKGTYEVNNVKAKFKIKFPVTNVKNSRTLQIIDGEEFEIFHYTANMQGQDNLNLGYQIDYAFLPGIKNAEDINQLFDEQRGFVISATNSKLEFENVIKLNNAPGRHLFFTIDESNLKTNYKMYFKNGVFYKLAVVTEEGKLFNKSISKFFNSFGILD